MLIKHSITNIFWEEYQSKAYLVFVFGKKNGIISTLSKKEKK
jgi:hypothetical protein